jgi:hypothetical protein
MVVDYVTISVDANRLQRACDAAALAGVSQLKRTGGLVVAAADLANLPTVDTANAATVAVNVAASNNVAITTDNVSFSSNNTRVRVSATATRSFFFAPIMGIRDGRVTRSATAGVAPGNSLSTARGGPRVAPIGISIETYEAYKNDRANHHDVTLIRQNKQTFGLDDAVLFDLRNQSGKSGDKMRDQLNGSEIQVSSVGDLETTLNAATGSESRKLADGLDTLFEDAAGAPWYDNGSTTTYNNIVAGTSPRTNPRVVHLIVTPSTSNPNNGTYNTEIKAFVPVYIESYNDGSTTTMRLRFLPPTEISDGSVAPNPDPNDPIAGVRVSRLID